MGLRPYQINDLDRVRERLRAGVRRVLLTQPTGAGKTVLATEMLGGANQRGKRSWFAVPRRELLDQTSEKFETAGIPHGFIAAGYPVDSEPNVQLCSVDTLARRLSECEAPDFIVPDEAHHIVAATWSKCLSGHERAKVVGLTATPERLDGKGLKDHFDELVVGPSVKQLISEGWLSPYKYFAPGEPDLVGVKVQGGDFNRGDIARVMKNAALVGDTVKTYLQKAAGLQGIVFGVDREHSRELAAAFQAAGVRAAHVDSTLSSKDRRALVDGFREGEFEILSNCELFGEGFDVPNVSYVGLARPTKSLSLHLQQVGRALRVLDGKSHAVICDHAGNAFRHGLPDDDRDWSLEGRKKRSRRVGGGDDLPVHQCPECYRVSPSSEQECPGCGFEFPAKVRSTSQAEGELTELKRLAQRKAIDLRKTEQAACRTLEDLVELATRRGYSSPHGWATNVYAARNAWRERRAG